MKMYQQKMHDYGMYRKKKRKKKTLHSAELSSREMTQIFNSTTNVITTNWY